MWKTDPLCGFGSFFHFSILISIYHSKYKIIVRGSHWSFGHSDLDPSSVSSLPNSISKIHSLCWIWNTSLDCSSDELVSLIIAVDAEHAWHYQKEPIVAENYGNLVYRVSEKGYKIR